MTKAISYSIRPIGFIRSDLKRRGNAPRQGAEGAHDAWLEISPAFADGLQGIAAGQQIIIITWLHEAERETLKVHPRGEPTRVD
jgi:tRNA (Thr-GGU) A37 N-methylase